ncbi:GH22874 [Drosophila grimshawi]|uniref:GH22874 n=1 Tax=Drosophila grimshawi TaxID=7222 RepID=B4JVU3_DROGR|nr:GH22874 [Drosophila grimshawi]
MPHATPLCRATRCCLGNQSDFQCKRQRFVLLTFVRPDDEEDDYDNEDEGE